MQRALQIYGFGKWEVLREFASVTNKRIPEVSKYGFQVVEQARWMLKHEGGSQSSDDEEAEKDQDESAKMPLTKKRKISAKWDNEKPQKEQADDPSITANGYPLRHYCICHKHAGNRL